VSRHVLISAVSSCALLGLFLGYPLLWILGAPSLEAGHLDLNFLVEVFSQRRNLRALENSLYGSFGAMLLSVVIGVPIAVLVARTDMPYRNVIRGLAAASFITPSFLLGFAYIMLLGPNNGLINQVLQFAFDFQTGPLDIYTLEGFVFLAALECVPLVVITVAAALQSMDGNLENAARMIGAGPLTVLVRITLPLVFPAIAAGALLAFISTISLYGAPAILGVRVVPTEIRAAIGDSNQQAMLAGLSLWLMLISLFAFYIYQRLLGRQARFVTVTGKWAPAETIRLGRWRYAAFACCVTYIMIALVLPYGVLTYASLSHAFGGKPGFQNVTLEHYAFIVSDALSLRAIVNSLVLAASAAVLATLFGLCISVLEITSPQRSTVKLLQYAAMLPFGLPSIVLGAGLVLAFTRPPLVLYGTLWILLVAYVVKFLPLAVRACGVGLRQMDPALAEAARITGASQYQTATRITAPLLRGSLMASAFLVFVPSFRELGASILLAGPGTETIAVAMIQSWGSVSFEKVCAIGVLALAVSWLASRVLGHAKLSTLTSAT